MLIARRQLAVLAPRSDKTVSNMANGFVVVTTIGAQTTRQTCHRDQLVGNVSVAEISR